MNNQCPPNHSHANATTCFHQHKCRCEQCTEHMRAKRRNDSREKAYGRYDRQLEPAVGVHRRIHGLIALGWRFTDIAAELGVHPDRVHQLTKQKTILPATRRNLIAAYERLIARGQGPSKRSRDYARKHGWLSPFAFDDLDNDPTPAGTPTRDPELVDDVRVQNTVDGTPAEHLTPAERRECVRILWARKWTDRKIGAQLGCDARTVYRIRGELGLPAFAYTEQVKQEAA